MAQKFVELNGNRYDAETGTLLHATDVSRAAKPAEKPNGTQSMNDVRRQPHHIAARRPEHSKTLRRDAVMHPVIARKQEIKVHTPAKLGNFLPDVMHVKPKLSSEVVDVARANRARAIPHSTKIERFRPVKPQHHHAFVLPTAAQPAVLVQPTVEIAEVPKAHDIFEQAIARADGHNQPALIVKTKRHARRINGRFVQIASSVAVFLLLVGFIAWQNRLSVEMQLASARSGVAASMPSYKPTGFALYQLNYSTGSITLGFRAPNNAAYTVTQQNSNWDSQTLLQNFVATSGQTYHSYLASGRTVYVYGTSATWVSGGIWYQINDDGSLSKNQIISLANSM